MGMAISVGKLGWDAPGPVRAFAQTAQPPSVARRKKPRLGPSCLGRGSWFIGDGCWVLLLGPQCVAMGCGGGGLSVFALELGEGRAVKINLV